MGAQRSTSPECGSEKGSCEESSSSGDSASHSVLVVAVAVAVAAAAPPSPPPLPPPLLPANRAPCSCARLARTSVPVPVTFGGSSSRSSAGSTSVCVMALNAVRASSGVYLLERADSSEMAPLSWLVVAACSCSCCACACCACSRACCAAA